MLIHLMAEKLNIAKMGKNETVSMDTLARIAAVMECGLDDIVEINAEKGGAK